MCKLAGLGYLTMGVLIIKILIYVSSGKDGQGKPSTGWTSPKAGWPWAAGQ